MAALGVIGIVLLAVASDQLVLGSIRLAVRMRMAPVVVGIVVIGFGTSAPELLTSGAAARDGHTALAVGGLTGSNVLNLTLILGVAGMAAPLTVRPSLIRREAPLAIGGVTLFAVLLIRGLDVMAGVILSVSLIAALIVLIRTSRDAPSTEIVGDVARHGLVREGLRAVAGLAGTLAGANLLVTNAAGMAARLGVSQRVVGFTLVAVGTSLPELITSIQAQRRGESDLVAGNLLGSNLFNSLAGGAVIAFAAHGDVTGAIAVIALMVGIGCLAWALLARGHRLTRAGSLALIVLYGLTLPLIT